MKKRELEQKLNKYFEEITPDISESVKNYCKEKEGTVIELTQQKPYKRSNISAIAAVFALVLLTAGLFGFYKVNTYEIAKIDLDVNPSIEISVGRNDKVLKAAPLNTDGEKILSGMDLKNTDIDVAVNSVLGSMLKNGYINGSANSILLSVDGKDNQKANKLKNMLSIQIKEYLIESDIESSVVSQNITESEKAVEEIADKFDISKGKAKYIRELIKVNPLYKSEELAKLNINELNVLSQKYEKTLDGVSIDGSPSKKGYITKEEAEKSALEHLGFNYSKVTALESEFDIEQINGKSAIIYEVEFLFDGTEYEVDVDAKTGKVIKADKDDTDSEDDEEDTIPDGKYITEEKAKEIALKNAGVKSDNVRNLKCKLEKDNSEIIYEVEFKTDCMEYEYKLDAVNGNILKHTEESDS